VATEGGREGGREGWREEQKALQMLRVVTAFRQRAEVTPDGAIDIGRLVV
jgi:hypothetical protein